MIKKIILAGLLLPASSLSFAAPNSDVIQQALMSSQYYQESCYFEPTIGEKFNLSNCNNYGFINLSHMKEDERLDITSAIFGIGMTTPYILINSPNSDTNRIITALEFFNRDITIDLVNNSNLVAPYIQTDLSQIDTASRNRRSINNQSGPDSSPTSEPTRYNWRFREVFNLNRSFYPTKNDIAILDYEIEAISKDPAYTQQSGANNPKFVRVTLVGGTGINFNPTSGSTYKQLTTKSPHQLSKYSYREYLNKVKISTSWSNNKAKLNDSFPKNNDNDRTGVQYESSLKVGFALNVPKLPIKEVTFDSSKKMTFENGNYFEYTAHSGVNSHSVEYNNKEFGTAFSKHTGYCNLIGPAKGCWKYTNKIKPSFESFDLLQDTPYSNGFVPKYSVTYQADRDTSGTSALTIMTEIEGLSLQGFSKWYIGDTHWAGVNSAGGYGPDYKINTYKRPIKLNIDWSSPVFTGLEPSVITFPYSSDDVAHCLAVGRDNSVNVDVCNPKNTNQLFIYTSDFKYVYANDNRLCLDSSQSSLTVTTCNSYSSNSQKWLWFTQPIGHNIYDNTLLYTTKGSGLFNVIKGSTTDNKLLLEEVDSLDTAFSVWPEAKLNTQSGKYLPAITKMN